MKLNASWIPLGIFTFAGVESLVGWRDIAIYIVGIVLMVYQRKLANDVARDEAAHRDTLAAKVKADAANLATGLAIAHRQVVSEGEDTRALIRDLSDRLSHVVHERDDLLAEVKKLRAEIDVCRCCYPRADGSAGCRPEGAPV